MPVPVSQSLDFVSISPLVRPEDLAFMKILASLPQTQKIVPIKTLFQSERSMVVLVFDQKAKVKRILKIGSPESLVSYESACLQQFSHPNIVTIVDYFEFPTASCILMEKVPGVCLVDYLDVEVTIPEKEASIIAEQLVSALSYIHKLGWIHRDLKPDNIIYDPKTRKVKLIDFEFSTQFSAWWKLTSKTGTVEYSPPEVRQGSYWGPEVDVWSLGVTIYVMLTGQFPFTEEDLSQDFVPMPSFETLSSCCEDLLSQIFQPVSTRASLQNVQNHPWIKRNKTSLALPPQGVELETSYAQPLWWSFLSERLLVA